MTCSRHAALLDLTDAILACDAGDPSVKLRARALRDQVRRDAVLQDALRKEAKFRAECGEPEGEVLLSLSLVRLPDGPMPYVLIGERSGEKLVWLVDCLARALAALPAFAGRLITAPFTRFGTRH